MNSIEKIDVEIAERQSKAFKCIHNADVEKAKAQNHGEIIGLELAKQIIISEQKECCEYILENDDTNTWECSRCGELWTLNAGSPRENNMKHCPGCGRTIQSPTDTA